MKTILVSIVALAFGLPALHAMLPPPVNINAVTAFAVLAAGIAIDYLGTGDPWTDRLAWCCYAAGGKSVAIGTGYVSWATTQYAHAFANVANATNGNLHEGLSKDGPNLGVIVFILWTFFILWPSEWAPSWGIFGFSLFQKAFTLKYNVSAHKHMNWTLIGTAAGWIAIAPIVPKGGVGMIYDFVTWFAQLGVQLIAVALAWMGLTV